jgi:hypothetical protein
VLIRVLKGRQMGGKRRLKAGAVRLLGTHDGVSGRAFRRAYDALGQEFDLSRPLARLEASRTAAAWANLEASTRALQAGRKARESGKGRRLGARDLERLARRHGLDDGSYAAAAARLETVAKKRSAQQPSTPAELLAATTDAQT